jgi:micrococcal nuclease
MRSVRAMTRGLACTLLALALFVPGLAFARDLRTCVRVVDGDTIVLDGGERVRLIGVDTPELHHPAKPVQYFAHEAKERTVALAQGRRVGLEYDHQRRDRYGRTLAYVFLPDGTLLNLRLIEEGYGFAYTKYPFRPDYMARFRNAERVARTQSHGLWAGREYRDR